MALPGTVNAMRELLLRTRVVDAYQMRSGLARLEQWGGRLPKVLADMGMVDEEQVAQVIAAELRLPVQPMGAVARDPAALGRLDADFCQEHGVFPVSLNARTRTLVLAMADPTALDVIDLVAARAGARVQPVVAPETQIQVAIGWHYRGQSPSAILGPNLARRAVTRVSAEDGDQPPLELATDPQLRSIPAAAPAGEPLQAAGEAEGFSAEQLTLLNELQRRQTQASTILRALQELLVEKGLT
jgi:hypothetical protein